MFRPFTTELARMTKRWSRRPVWSVSIGFLVLLLSVSGPFACLLHCEVSGEGHGSHHHHQHVHQHEFVLAAVTTRVAPDTHGLLMVNERGDHAICDYVVSQSSDAVPSALTIGVVLTTNFALPMATILVRVLDLKPQIRLIALPPPPDPPRSAPSLAF